MEIGKPLRITSARDVCHQIPKRGEEVRTQNIPPEVLRYFVASYGVECFLAEKMIEELRMGKATMILGAVLDEKRHDQSTILKYSLHVGVHEMGSGLVQGDFHHPDERYLVSGFSLIVGYETRHFSKKLRHESMTLRNIHDRLDRSAELADFSIEHELHEKRQRRSRSLVLDDIRDFRDRQLRQKKRTQCIGVRLEQFADGREVVVLPSLVPQPGFGDLLGRWLQSQRGNPVPGRQRMNVPTDSLGADERVATGKNDYAASAYLTDELVELAPGIVVATWIAQLVEAVDGKNNQAVTDQDGHLIERYRHSHSLQAERDQVLDERQYSPAALHVEQQRTLVHHVVGCA